MSLTCDWCDEDFQPGEAVRATDEWSTYHEGCYVRCLEVERLLEELLGSVRVIAA